MPKKQSKAVAEKKPGGSGAHHTALCGTGDGGADEELRETERRLRQIIDGNSIPTFVLDEDHVVTHWNKACEKMTGVPAVRVAGTRNQWMAFYSFERPVLADFLIDEPSEKEIAKWYDGKYRRSLFTEGAYEAEDFFPHLGGGGRWLFFSAAPLMNGAGEVIGAIETFQDITGQKKAEEESKESGERLLTVIEVVDEGITFSDMEGHFEIFNSKMREITGYTREEANDHRDFLTLLYPDPEKRARAVKGIEAVFLRGKSGDIETTVRDKSGLEKTLLVSTSLVRYKDKNMLLSSYRDITQRKKMEEELLKQRWHLEELVKERTEELRKSEEKYRSIVETSPGGIWMVDAKNKMTFINQRMADMLGYDAEELMDSSLFAYIGGENKADSSDATSRAAGTELEFPRKDGSVLWTLVRSSPMYDKDGRRIGVLGTVTDITERKKAEETLQKAYDELRELDRMKDDFLATTSHSLKTPVTSILSLTQILNEELSGVVDKEQKEDLCIILKESIRLKKLINDILNMYRLESKTRLRMTDVQLEELMDNALSLMKNRAGEKGIGLAKELAEKLPLVHASPDDLQEVFLNLMDNAIKFTPSGGQISVGARKEGLDIIAWVSDTGIGIPDGEQARLFDKFAQGNSAASRASGGIGLGLAICRKIMEAHGGSIWIESPRGNAGTAFYFRIKTVN